GDMLANLFLLSSFLLYWRVSAGTGNNPSGERRAHDVLCVTGAILCYVAALLSKETAIVLPFLVLACALVFRERRNRTASIILVVCLFCCMLVYAVLRETCLKFGVSTTAPLPLGTRLLNACQAFATYVRLLLVPVGLHMERTIDEVSPAAVIFTIAVLAAACIFVWKRWRESPGTAFALLWFVIAWLPISGIYPLNAAIAEHWLYLPSIGFLAFVVGSFDRILTSEQRLFPPKLARTLSIGSLAVILLCFTALTIRRNGDWRDNFTLYTKTLEKAPNSSRVHYNLAIVYEQRGEDEKALGEFLETLRLDPDNAYVRLDLAVIRARKGEQEEAARLYMEAIRLNPNDPDMVEAYVNLARIYHQRGQREESTKLMQKAYQVNPEAMRRWFPQVGQP
ncbi:MAG: tetratricopeptide repeat protein, partial [Candidatus Hydrogenedentes bacterium]|nr:tetratricopeptide repeat protein [Candidatus Hydrogenedentota bacterium]